MIQTEFLKRYLDETGSISHQALNLDQDLTNLCWLPLPRTRIEPDSWSLFWQLWDDHKGFMSREGRSTALWETLCIWKSPHLSDSEVTHPHYPQNIVDWRLYFPKMFHQIFTLMPYEVIWKITLGTSLKRVPVHVDLPQFGGLDARARHGVLYPWPNSLRIMLYDENTEPTFFITPWPQQIIQQGKIRDVTALNEWASIEEPSPRHKCYVRLTGDANSFVFSNGEFLHGSDYLGKKKIILLVWGQPAIEPWKQKLKVIKREMLNQNQSLDAFKLKP